MVCGMKQKKNTQEEQLVKRLLRPKQDLIYPGIQLNTVQENKVNVHL